MMFQGFIHLFSRKGRLKKLNFKIKIKIEIFNQEIKFCYIKFSLFKF